MRRRFFCTTGASFTLAGTELPGACVSESLNSSTNASGQLLKNYATIPVCTTSNPLPDGAQLHSSDPAAGIYCFIDYEVPAAKRPATTGTYPRQINTKTPILWRPFVSGVKFAN